ncbi:hypothetical protein HPP92_015817 [Vanilla planifolia]|uniref:DUF7906 domain-containing protein n=1 Tax=Vanilla planifolia TaxID=51239 RepID=A0A835QIK9_VANPL|nr:hypothetical protein HPP92_015817 [Vanilla planifolia]
MGEEVTSVFEQAITALSRKEVLFDSRAGEDVVWQVDIDKMAYIFSTLVDYLKIDDTYNIFVLNPKYRNKRLHYGYRRGLSESEINFLKELRAKDEEVKEFVVLVNVNENKTLQALVLQSEHAKGNALEIDNIIPRPLHLNRPASNFVWTTTEEVNTVEWSKKYSDALTHAENEGKDDVGVLYDKIVKMLHDKKDDLNYLLGEALKSGDFTGLHSECLTDTWIGGNRWAFIDLSAGPFSWGPAVGGGEGVRTELSLPNVNKTIGAVAELTEVEAEEKLQDAIRERFSSFDGKITNMKKLPVNLKAFTDGLSSLAVTSQRLALSDDPALTMAFSVARRAAAVPLLLINGTYRLTTVLILIPPFCNANYKRTHSDSRSTLEIPIFWFIHTDPLLIDKHYRARALSDMVIVVQSDESSWESHLQFYSQAHETAIEDWSWSVGCNPVSITSQGWHLSQFQSDAIARAISLLLLRSLYWL